MIDVQGISFSYRRSAPPALLDVSLQVAEGEVVGIVGENGAGKTTLLKLVAGLLAPAAGAIRVGGRNERSAIRSQVAYMPDEGGVYPFLTVAEAGDFLASALPGWDRGRWERALAALDLPRERLGGELSRGERARLRFAQAVAQNCPVLVLDEPLAGIDPASRERIVAQLAGDLAATGRTLLVATHEVDEVETLLDRVVCLRRGAVILDTSPDELRRATGLSVHQYLRREGER